MASWLDRLLGRAAEPAAAPVRQRIARGARAEYDGATIGRRAGGWRRTRLDANAELSPAASAALRAIARDLVRNNPWAARGVAGIANNMVGTGITFQVRRDGKVDDTLNALAQRHFDTTACDAGGLHDLYGLQLQAARTIVEGGAALMRRRWRRRADRLPLPFQLQVLEADYLDASKHGQLAVAPGAVGGFIINGIQFDPIGRREGYWLYAGHPGGQRTRLTGSSFVPAADVAHVFRADRPEQEHGATWLAPVILRTKDFGDYEDAQLMRQKIATSFAGFRTSEQGNTSPLMGQDPTVGGDRDPMEFVEPGTISDLAPGESISWSEPPEVDGYADYARVSLRAIAAGLGVPYEVLTGDLSNVNYSSGRMGWLEFQRSIAAWQWLMFIPRFCGAVEQWFRDGAEMMGHDLRGVTLEWTPPRREMMDPASEVPATRNAIRAGLMTLPAAIRERGEDPDRVFAEHAETAEILDRLGLTFDSDPRRVTAVGNPTEQPTTQPGT